jgi:hypothetical protein
MVQSQTVYISGFGYFQVALVDSPTLVELYNWGYAGNATSGTCPSGTAIAASGAQGSTGPTGPAAQSNFIQYTGAQYPSYLGNYVPYAGVSVSVGSTAQKVVVDYQLGIWNGSGAPITVGLAPYANNGSLGAVIMKTIAGATAGTIYDTLTMSFETQPNQVSTGSVSFQLYAALLAGITSNVTYGYASVRAQVVNA